MAGGEKEIVGEKDLEARRPAQISHFKRILQQDALTQDIIDHHYPGAGTEEDPYIVTWIDQDPVDPMNYSIIKKWSITMLVAIATLVSNSPNQKKKTWKLSLAD